MLLGFRKVIVILVLIAACCAFLVTGHITAEQFASILSVSVPSFMGANLVEHFKREEK